MIALLLFIAVQAEGGGGQAPAPQEDARAKELYNAGSAAYGQANYVVAIEAFEEARKLSPRAVITFSLAQAYRLQYFIDGDEARLERAVALYRAYLDEEPSGGRRDHAAQHLSTLEPLLAAKRAAAQSLEEEDKTPKLARVIVSSQTAGATARLDDGEPQPIPATFEVTPGDHKFFVESARHVSETRNISAVAGTTVAVNVDLAPQKGAVLVKAPPGSVVVVDGRAVVAGEPVPLNPGEHAISVSMHGHEPFTRNVFVRSAQTEAVAAELSRTGQSVAGFVVVGVGAVLAGSALVPGGVGLAIESEARAVESTAQTRALSVSEAQRYGALEAERDFYVRTSLALAVGGAIAATAGAFLLALDEAPPIVASETSAE